MSRIELLLVQLDAACGRLIRRLEGLTDEEYLWQPVPGGWSIRTGEHGRWAADYAFPDPVPAPFTTSAWRLLHIADCKIMYHEYAYGAGTLTSPTWRPRGPRRWQSPDLSRVRNSCETT